MPADYADAAVSLNHAISMAVVAALGGGGAITGLFGWLAGRKRTQADVDKTTAEVEEMLRKALVAELDRRDEECQRQIDLKIRQLQAERDMALAPLKSIIYSLAMKRPLDPDQKALLAEIAPNAEPQDS